MTEALANGPEVAIARSEAHINDYLFRGGADTEMEDVEIAEKFGVADLVKAAWADAKEMQEAWEEHAKRSVDVNEAEPLYFLSETQPTLAGDAIGVVEAKAAQSREAGAEPQPEPRAGDVAFAGEREIVDDGNPVILSKASPYDSALEFVRRNFVRDGALTVYWWNGSFWRWNGRCYEKASVDKITANVWAFLDEARTGTDKVRFRPKPHDAEGVMKALKAGLTLDVDPPCWLDGGGKASGVLVFKNGIVARLIAVQPGDRTCIRLVQDQRLLVGEGQNVLLLTTDVFTF
jgi:hypothetical protein